MLSKKYIPIILGTLCLLLLLSLVSNFMAWAEKRKMEGFSTEDEEEENDKFNEVAEKFLKKVIDTKAFTKAHVKVSEEDAIVFDDVLKRKMLKFLKGI